MERSTRRWIRAAAIGALVLGALHVSSNELTGMKGIRALVFSGESLKEPVRIGDPELATGFWLRLRRGGHNLTADSMAVLNGRRCVTISAFIFNDRSDVPVDVLPAGHGDYTYRVYLFPRGTLPVIVAGPQVWRTTMEVADEFAALGVPTADSARAAVRCR